MNAMGYVAGLLNLLRYRRVAVLFTPFIGTVSQQVLRQTG